SVGARYGKLMEECERYPMEIQIARGRLKELEGKINALKSAPIGQLTLAAADKDDDVIKESLRTKAAKSKYLFARSAAGGDESAPAVMNLKRIYESHEAQLKQIREEKARAI